MFVLQLFLRTYGDQNKGDKTLFSSPSLVSAKLKPILKITKLYKELTVDEKYNLLMKSVQMLNDSFWTF